MKTLVVKFTFTIMPDEFGLYSLPDEAAQWIKAQRGDLISELAVMEVLPIEDAPTPGGLTRVRKRTRGPNKPRDPALSAERRREIARETPVTIIGANGAGAEVAQGAGEGT